MANLRASLLSFELTSAGEFVAVEVDKDTACCEFLVVRDTGITVVPPFGGVIVDEPDTDRVLFPIPSMAAVKATVEVRIGV
jgi:hypothetical protein